MSFAESCVAPNSNESVCPVARSSDYDVEPLPPNAAEPAREAVDLSDLLKVLATRIEDFKDLLIVPRSTVWISSSIAGSFHLLQTTPLIHFMYFKIMTDWTYSDIDWKADPSWI